MTLEPTDLPEEAAETHPELNHERGIPRPVRWLLVITLVVLLLFCCGQMALWNPLPIGRSDTRSKLSADYGPWPFIRIAVVNPDILDDLVRDLAHEGGTGTPSIPQLGPQVDIWSALGLENAPTNTSVPPTHTSIPPTSTGVRLNTPTPTRTRAPTASPTLTRTPTRIFIPTRTPTGLSTAASTFTSLPPPTSTQPNTPVVVPTNINPPAPTATLSPTVTLTDTPTITATPTVTPTPTVSATSTTPTPTVTATPTATPTLTNTPVPCSGSNPGGLNIGGPDDSVAEIGCGQFIIVDLGSGAIDTTTPDATYDFIQYERAAGSGVLLDWVITEISADPSGACGISATWLPILNWGDGNSGNNGNVPASYLPEIDNRDIFSGDLYASTGIAVDLEALGIPAGVYPCVRISSPLNGDNDPAEVDSIQILNP